MYIHKYNKYKEKYLKLKGGVITDDEMKNILTNNFSKKKLNQIFLNHINNEIKKNNINTFISDIENFITDFFNIFKKNILTNTFYKNENLNKKYYNPIIKKIDDIENFIKKIKIKEDFDINFNSKSDNILHDYYLKFLDELYNNLITDKTKLNDIDYYNNILNTIKDNIGNLNTNIINYPINTKNISNNLKNYEYCHLLCSNIQSNLESFFKYFKDYTKYTYFLIFKNLKSNAKTFINNITFNLINK